MPYATDKQVELGESLGYFPTRTTERGSSFVKGKRNVWSTRRGWQTADLVEGYYRNHRMFDKLEDALQREIK